MPPAPRYQHDEPYASRGPHPDRRVIRCDQPRSLRPCRRLSGYIPAAATTRPSSPGSRLKTWGYSGRRNTAHATRRRVAILVYACFVGIGDPGRREPAQPGGIPRFFTSSVETGAGTRHRAGSDCSQTPDHDWPFMWSWCLTSGPMARSRWSTTSSSAPAAETGPVPLVNLRSILIRQDRGNSGQSAKILYFSVYYSSSQTAGPYPIFVSEAVTIKLLTTIGFP